MKDFELNFVWVGNKVMPAAQLVNFNKICHRYIGACINLWTIPELLHPEMQTAANGQATIRNIKDLSIDPVTAPKTFAIINRLQTAELWSSLGDILKLRILTRDLEPGMPSKRFYMETDNNYTKNLQDIVNHEIKDLQKNANANFFTMLRNMFSKTQTMSKTISRGVVFHLENNSIRPDSFFVDITSDEGKLLQQGFMTHLERLLSDYFINTCIHAMIDHKEKTKAIHYMDVINVFGHFNDMLLRMIMLPKNRNFIQTNGCVDFCNHGKYSPWSWRQKDGQLLNDGYVSALVWFRLQELLCDRVVSGNYYIKILKNNETLLNIDQQIVAAKNDLRKFEEQAIYRLTNHIERNARGRNHFQTERNELKGKLHNLIQSYNTTYMQEAAKFEQGLLLQFKQHDNQFIRRGIADCSNDKVTVKFSALPAITFSRSKAYQMFADEYGQQNAKDKNPVRYLPKAKL